MTGRRVSAVLSVLLVPLTLAGIHDVIVGAVELLALPMGPEYNFMYRVYHTLAFIYCGIFVVHLLLAVYAATGKALPQLLVDSK